jgi:hypothetical protein
MLDEKPQKRIQGESKPSVVRFKDLPAAVRHRLEMLELLEQAFDKSGNKVMIRLK